MSKEKDGALNFGCSSRRGRRVVDQHQPVMLGGVANTITPCAACKLLRRRCAQECPFSPYFSPHEPHKFASVHKVFGASNVSKMLMEVPEGQRADAANSLVYEANARIRDPVYGCMGTISKLQRQAHTLQAELNAVRNEIHRYRCQESSLAAAAVHNPDSALLVIGSFSGSLNNPLGSAAPYSSTLSSAPLQQLDLPKDRYW